MKIYIGRKLVVAFVKEHERFSLWIANRGLFDDGEDLALSYASSDKAEVMKRFNEAKMIAG